MNSCAVTLIGFRFFKITSIHWQITFSYENPPQHTHYKTPKTRELEIQEHFIRFSFTGLKGIGVDDKQKRCGRNIRSQNEATINY